MNSMERFLHRLAGEPVDQVPNHCIIMGFGARRIGRSYREFVTDYRVLSEAMIRCREEFQLDILSAISDPMREAEGFGAEIRYPEDGVPYAVRPRIADYADVGRLRVSDPASCKRMNDRLLAVRAMSDYAAGECPVQGWVEGAFAEACDLRDLNVMMLDVLEEPEAVEELLEVCTEQAIRFALAQLEAGAQIIGIGDAAASLIGPALYEEFAMPYEMRIVKAVQQAGGRAKLHICGDINRILEPAMETGADLIDCDWMVDFRRANELFGTAHSACGNFDPVGVLLQSTPAQVQEAVEGCLAASGSRSFLAAGCEVPPFTPLENLKAVADALAHRKGCGA